MSTPLIKRLHAERMKIEGEIRTLIDLAETEKRELSSDEDGKIDELAKRSTDIDGNLTGLIEAEERARAIDAKLGDIEPAPDSGPETNKVEDQIRSFLRGEGRALTIRPEARDLTKGSATAGGNTVPTSFYGMLVEHLIEVAGVMNAGATILRTDSGEAFEVPTTTAHSSAALTAEGAAISESDPAFTKRTLNAYKYGNVVQVSRELVEDSGVDLLGYLAMQCGRAVGNAFGAHLATGTGSSQPAGIVTGAAAGVTGGAGVAGAFTADNLIDLYYSVIGPYRNSPSCGWLLRDASVATMRKLKDTAGQYLWSPATDPGRPDSFLGKAVYTDPTIPAVALSGKSVLFGDFSAYFVRMVNDIRFERSDEFAFVNDLVTFKCVVRGDGVLVDQTGAVKSFTGNAA